MEFISWSLQPILTSKKTENRAGKQSNSTESQTSHNFFVYRAGGEFAEMVYGLDNVWWLLRHTGRNTRSVGALRTPTADVSPDWRLYARDSRPVGGF